MSTKSSTHILLDTLNPEQRRAVETIAGPLLIIAGAGSGKTRVITHRIALMIEQGISAKSILALTFTNKAATEMRERVQALLSELHGRAAKSMMSDLTVSTFHAFGLSVLRRYGRLLGYRNNFTVYDTSDQISMLKEAARELRINPDDLSLFDVLQGFSGIKTERINWSDDRWYGMLSPEGGGGVSRFQDLFESYVQHLVVYNAVDFDDLIVQPLRLFREHPQVREHYADRYQYILVDEFQDTSTVQYNILYQLGRETQNVCVVGDDDQSIYSWRGADYSNIESFERDFPGTVEIKLERNYRSTGHILQAANSVIANNKNRKLKELWTHIDTGTPIELSFPENEEAEARFIAERIKLLAFQEGVPYDSFGILIRTNGQARAIEEALLAADVPYRMTGGQSFFQRKEIKDVAGYLRILLNPDDDVNLLRIINTPRRGIGRKTLEQLHELAETRRWSLYSTISAVVHGEISHSINSGSVKSMEELLSLIESQQSAFEDVRAGYIAHQVEKLVHEIDYWPYLIVEHQKNDRVAKAKWRNISLFVKSIENYERNPDVLAPSLAGFLNRISLQVRDELDEESDRGKVHLMTIHAAKGLEHEVVFLAGVEDGVLPHQRSVDERGDAEEERRLFYVAITRAKKQLYMTSCRRRQVMREVVDSSPSPFIQEIPEDLLSVRDTDPGAGIELPTDPFAMMKERFGGS